MPIRPHPEERAQARVSKDEGGPSSGLSNVNEPISGQA
jgi:hypothetical protein